MVIKMLALDCPAPKTEARTQAMRTVVSTEFSFFLCFDVALQSRIRNASA